MSSQGSKASSSVWGGGVPLPLFPWNSSAFSLVPQNQNLNFLCSLLPKLHLFSCSLHFQTCVPLFPWNKWHYSPVPHDPWEGLSKRSACTDVQADPSLCWVHMQSYSKCCIPVKLYKCLDKSIITLNFLLFVLLLYQCYFWIWIFINNLMKIDTLNHRLSYYNFEDRFLF